MQRITKGLGATAVIVGLGLGGYGVAAATTDAPATDDEGDDTDAPLTGDILDRATTAALDHTGGGDVVETEEGDDGAAYGVEIVLPDGSRVEVNLDEDFVVISTEADDD